MVYDGMVDGVKNPELIEELEFEDYISLPENFEINEYQMIEEFILNLPAGNSQKVLAHAIQGKGAFRRFKDKLYDLNLEKHWYQYRDEADEKDKEILMIWRVPVGKGAGKVMPISQRTFGTVWFDKFIKDNNIKYANGDYYNLTSHQFRRTLGTDMLSKGTNINVIQQVLGHSDPSVTKRFYADVKDKERAEVFKSIGVIGNINQIQSSAFDNVSEFEWFKANKDKGACMCDGYCTKPVVDGKICDRLLKRQKCYTCSRYITTPEYLEAHKKHLANLEKQLEEGTIYGEHYAEHFIPTIEVLKVIIERLEGLQNGN